MKLIILQSKLKKGLNIVERISAKSLSLPILKNVLFKTEKNYLSLSATDLEMGIKWWTLAQVEKEGEIVIPSSIFSNFINFLPDKKITLSSKQDNLLVECENYKTQLKGFSTEDFPIIPRAKGEEHVLINNQVLCQGLEQLADIPVFSTVKPEISGIYFSFQKKTLKVAATDSYRLGEKIIPLENTLEKEYNFIIPQKTIKEIINIFKEKEGSIKIVFDPNQVMFEYKMEEVSHPEIELTTRLIEGEYPRYEEIIPKKYETQIVAEKNELFNQIKAASLFSGKVNEIKLKVDPEKNKVEIISQSSDLGQHQSFVKAKIKGKKEEISFNYRFLVDGLASIKSSEVILELSGESGPGVLKPLGDANFVYVVMPIKSN